ncbi:PREDICTED: small integral membrane protein 24 isoform X2 [Poecilia mexicana]|uniref:small integral membrane protein 24 isoform X2 n=1 Tax=Poecilia mexicana TaxID=48701 RepID=UPI00072E7F14|nr:PREDICTED: small integral membrane protein 24 isoform X2 [Poecilia mexicana]
MFVSDSEMGRTELTSCVLVLVGAAAAQTDQASQPERLLPQWLTGIVAVCSFLLLTFIAALVKKVWCESSRSSSVDAAFAETNPYESNLDGLRPRSSLESEKGKYETRLDLARARDGSNVYDNVITAEEKSTAM